MQTFLPYADFEQSARVLDVKRLGKQRVEAIQVVRALTVPGYEWARHPAVPMWKRHEEDLGRYGLTCCDVWVELGFGDTCSDTIAADLHSAGVTQIRSQRALGDVDALPAWHDDEEFHRSHRSVLIQTDPGHYRRPSRVRRTTCLICGRSGHRPCSPLRNRGQSTPYAVRSGKRHAPSRRRSA